jgi:hypothetical protein
MLVKIVPPAGVCMKMREIPSDCTDCYVAVIPANKRKAWKPLIEHCDAKNLSTYRGSRHSGRRTARAAWPIYTRKTELDPARLTTCLA